MVSIFNRESQKHLRRVDFATDVKGVFEFKKVFAMPIGRLQQFHGAMIEVELDIQGHLRAISGKGSYDADDPDLGPVLRILVVDSSGNFEVLIAESEWSGHIGVSKLPGCDYRLSLASRTLC